MTTVKHPSEEKRIKKRTRSADFKMEPRLGLWLYVTLCVISILPQGLLGNHADVMPRVQRVKRGWVWNQFFVLEEYTGLDPLYIGKLHSDMDKGDGSIKYILTGEGAGTTFTIDDSTGDIHAIQRLDREGTSVIQLTATDADDPTYGNSARVVYSILEGQPYFSVDAKTGVVRVSLADMDRETRENYTVVIQAKDMGGQLGGLAGTARVDISLGDVNDNPPVFDQRLYQMSVPESASVDSEVGRIWAKDRDVGVNADMTYSVIDGDGRDTFGIVTDPGNRYAIITVKKPLDFETKRSYTLKVEGANIHVETASYSSSYSSFSSFALFSSSSLPTFNILLLHIIFLFLVFLFRYSLDRSSDPDKFFYVDITSGALMTLRPLDREQLGWHNISVLAMEMNNPSQLSSVAVSIRVQDVNDNPPTLSDSLEAFVCNGAKAGQLIQAVTAVDPDDPPSGHHFSYALAPHAANNPNFTLRDNQDNTAWIVTRRGGWSQREQSIFYLPITVTDGEAPVHISTSTLSVRVCACDRDGNVMTCNPEAYSLPASLSRAALIAILSAIFVLLVMILLMLSLRTHRKKPYLSDEEENVHENIVRYDDEGGGEEDTEAFDIAAMWNPCEVHPHASETRQDMFPEIQTLSRYVPMADAGSSGVHGYVLSKLLEADVDPCAPPYDSLQTYAYEGEGSVAESLSSLQSGVSSSDHEYDYLNDWGPRFKKLAEMYGVLDANSPPMW
uniref:Cadherin-20 n=1 Tax=Hippocampus comes TaxID=109280 RepID=A0A3Q2XQR1_HIPCM